MACVIAKLTKTDEEKDMQIASLINKVEAQVQNMSESSQGLNHLLNVAFPLNDAPHAYRTMQVERQTIEYASMEGKSKTTWHFVETCNNAGTDGDLLVKQFIHSLQGNAFDWYINLAPECINSWDQMEHYINLWHSLSLDCKDRLFEVSAMEICIQGMHWVSYTFSKGYDPDLTIDLQRERHDGKKSDKTLKKPIEESKTINTPPVKISARDKKNVVKEAGPIQENERCRFTLKELEEKKYHFLDFDVPNMLEDLLQKKVLFAIISSTRKAKLKGKLKQSKTKKTKASTQHIIVEDIEESSGSNSLSQILVFDRIEAPITRASVFTRLEVDSNLESSEEEPGEALQAFEDGGQANVDELKELNLDDFPLPIIELMVGATTGHKSLSFMDGSSGCNQIRMVLRDEELTAFRTPKGIYCYKVIPFGLKNAGAMYQRAMQKIFDDMFHKNVECYVDDLVVKSRKREDHL
ncbi:Transposon Ty3-I Gag-Pol polyprotein [Vitis vinifera]|uniref:Transposon Ty3-I Gag-Pol polyprotein n=1 Tax=Vitis vinifera TaxID=29760 RepID=A0A438I300_VITVI|nr:Transposon Ty3-I Gag-Pol polyprotein [Vitis vinifera]